MMAVCPHCQRKIAVRRWKIGQPDEVRRFANHWPLASPKPESYRMCRGSAELVPNDKLA